MDTSIYPLLLLQIYDSEINLHYLKRYIKLIRYYKFIEPTTRPKYYEEHHIYPNNQCSDKFSKDSNNLVLLPLRVHFIAHWLLWKAFPKNRAMIWAFNQMCGRVNYRLSSKIYESMKKDFYNNHPMKDKEFYEKSRKTCLERYGVEYANQYPEIQEQRKQTCLEIYGVDNPFKSPEFQEQIKQTNLDRYGYDNLFKSPEFQEQIRQTNIEKYGVDNPFKAETIKEQIRQYWLTTIGYDHPNKTPKRRQEISKNMFDRVKKGTHPSQIKVSCLCCRKEFDISNFKKWHGEKCRHK